MIKKTFIKDFIHVLDFKKQMEQVNNKSEEIKQTIIKIDRSMSFLLCDFYIFNLYYFL